MLCIYFNNIYGMYKYVIYIIHTNDTFLYIKDAKCSGLGGHNYIYW